RQSGVFRGYFFAREKKYLAARWRVSAWQAAGRKHRKHQMANQARPLPAGSRKNAIRAPGWRA
ncbi:hypothetical protein B0684_00005, partial [Thioalkalivibrio versutus]